jgi:uncharacterized membrane protein YqjE
LHKNFFPALDCGLIKLEVWASKIFFALLIWALSEEWRFINKLLKTVVVHPVAAVGPLWPVVL